MIRVAADDGDVPPYHRMTELTDERLTELAARITPIVRNGGIPYVIELPRDLREDSFVWYPRFTTIASGLVPLATIRTYHRYRYYEIFVPTVDEVLAQIPPEITSRTVAFEVVARPSAAEEFGRDSTLRHTRLHVAFTRLYGRA